MKVWLFEATGQLYEPIKTVSSPEAEGPKKLPMIDSWPPTAANKLVGVIAEMVGRL